jgi:outer membrane lipoprotein SlyB
MRPFLLRSAAATLALGLAACAPQNMNSTVSAYGVGQVAALEYGTIVGLRPVNIAGSQSGLGLATGGVAGGVIGSTIGGDWRARAVGGVLGAAVGAVGGGLIENAVTSGQAVEFIVRMDNSRADTAVVQTNEDGLQVGERVAVTFGERARLMRAGGTAPGYAPAYATPVSGGVRKR